MPRAIAMVLALLFSSAPPVFAAGSLTPKVVLHVSAPTTKAQTVCSTWSPTGQGIPCSNYVVNGPLGQNLVAYMVVAQVDTVPGDVSGVSIGVEYNGDEGQGLDVFAWRMCADGIQYPNAGPRGEWPASGSGNVITWLTCQNTRIGNDGVHALVGAFYVYAYSEDVLRLTPNRNVSSPAFLLANCRGAENQPDSAVALGWAGFGVPGRNPCTFCPRPLDATVDIDPNNLNVGGQGNFVTAHIELTPNHDLTLIDPASIRIDGFVPALPGFFDVGDWNANGVSDLSVKFDRDAVESLFGYPTDGQVTLTISGLIDVCSFSGIDHIRLIRPKISHPHGGEMYIAGSRVLVEWKNPNGWHPDHAEINYSSDGGANWQLVSDYVNGENYVWEVPQDLTESGRIRVVLMDDNGVMGYDTSESMFSVRTATTGIGSGVPTIHRLYANSPNPFRGITRSSFDLPEASRATVRVYDLKGQVVRELADDMYPAGNHEVTWDGRDSGGRPVASGIYLLHFKTGSFSDAKRMYLRR